MNEDGVATSDLDTIVAVHAESGPPLTLSVPTSWRQLPVLRAVVESALLGADWVIDDVADVKLGVDELCSELIALAAADGRIDLTLALAGHGIVGDLSTVLVPGARLTTTGFGWHVVESVTDARTVTYTDVGDRRAVTVRFAKLRS